MSHPASFPPFLPGASPGALPPIPSGGSTPAYSPTGGIAQLPKQILLFLPEERPIPSAIELNTLGQKGTLAFENNIEIPGAGFQVPDGSLARISSVTFYVTNLLASSVLSFTLLINGAPAPGYSNLVIFPRVASSVNPSFEAFIRVPNGARLQVTYTNGDGGAYQVGAALSGWFWTQSAGDRWLAAGT